jgi:hypothetical protein
MRFARFLAVASLALPLSLQAQSEFRIGILAAPTTRNSAFGTSVSQNTSSAGGIFDLVARTPWIGVSLRTSNADFGGGLSLAAGDARLLLGPQIFTLEIGGTQRVLAGQLASAKLTLGRVGARSTFLLGGSGLRGSIGAWALSAQTKPAGVNNVSGLEGETALQYLFPSLPLYVQLGYRREVLNIEYTTKKGPEEVGALVLGGGILWGGGRAH